MSQEFCNMHALYLLIEWLRYRCCWSISRGQNVCPKEKFSVHGRPEPSCVTWVQVCRLRQTDIKPDWHGGRAKVGRKQASAGQVSGTHNCTTAPVCDPSNRIWGLVSRFLTSIHQELPEPFKETDCWHPECEPGPQIGSPGNRRAVVRV